MIKTGKKVVSGGESKPDVGSFAAFVVGGDGLVGNESLLVTCDDEGVQFMNEKKEVVTELEEGDVLVRIPKGFHALVTKAENPPRSWDGGNTPALARRIWVNLSTSARIADSNGDEVTLEEGFITKLSYECYMTSKKA